MQKKQTIFVLRDLIPNIVPFIRQKDKVRGKLEERVLIIASDISLVKLLS